MIEDVCMILQTLILKFEDFLFASTQQIFILSTDVTLVTDKTHYLTFNSHHLLGHEKG